VEGLRVDVASGPIIVGNPQLRETAPGSRVLQQVAAAEAVQARWFDASGVPQAGAAGAPIQFVMVADGYQSGQEELFFAKVQALVAAMFGGGSTSAFKPLGDYKALFEMVAVFVPSSEGIRSDGKVSDSAFRTSNPAGFVSGDYGRVIGFVDALATDSAFHLPVVLLNTELGRSGVARGVTWLTANGGEIAATFVHETGHSLFRFGDEYADAGISPASPGPGAFESVHLSSSPTQVPWSHWLGYEDDLGTVGVYEGGNYRETGVWRATSASMMRSSFGVEFNAPQKEAVVARLYEFWGDYLTLVMDDRMGFVAQSLAPGVLNYEWRVDGKVLAHTGLSLSTDQMQALGAAPLQRHVVEVRTVDNSGWLRLPELLTASRQSETKAVVWGTTGSDAIFGTAEDEWLIGGAGDDMLDGGSGADTAVFPGPRAGYAIAWSPATSTFTVSSVGEGVDTLKNVESLRFSDVTALASSFQANTGPTLTTGGAARVTVSSNLTLTFSEPVQRGSGTITLRRADGAVVEQFDAATSSRITLQGSTLTLDPSADLAGSTGFYLEVSPGAIKDLAGNGFIGSSSYDFSTQSQAGDISAPTATKWGPADSAKAVPVGANLAITFNELIQAGTGPITLKTADGKVMETFTVANATVSGSTLTLNPKADLSIFTKYVVELGAGAVKDLAGNNNASDSRYDFQTATQDGLYHFFVVAFAAAPGATYMGQLAEAVNFGLPLNQIVEIFTTKTQFTSVYPTTMSNRELATQLVNNIVKNSASAATRQSAIDDIDAALGIGWSRGKMLYTVFGNLANLPLTDPTWGATAQQFQKQLAVARYFTEEMGVATENLAKLRGVIGSVTPDTDVSTVDKIVQIIGTVPPGG
jgi:methionine-rich copper-binding protein CopC